MSDLFNISGRKAIVTGALGGIGSEFTRTLLEAGAAVAMLDMESQMPLLNEKFKAYKEAFPVACNLLDKEDRDRAFEEAVRKLGGKLDILVNSAGVQKRGRIEEFTDEMWDFVMEINLNAVFAMTRMAGKYMIPQGSGKIVNIASMNSYFGGTNVPAYASSKGAIVQLTKAVANEWSKYGINANAIAPGFIETAMTQDMKEDKEVYEYKRGRIPYGRWGRPDDLAGTLLFLCSGASDYLCGVTIPVDGGYLCK